MSKGTVPILTCDHEYGCDIWEIDHYEMGASVPKLPEGWAPDPKYPNDYMFCPKHAGEVVSE